MKMGKTCLFQATRELGVRLRLHVFCRDTSTRPPSSRRWLGGVRRGVHRARLWPFFLCLLPHVGVAPAHGIVVHHALRRLRSPPLQHAAHERTGPRER